jgi:hypothetical protein
MWSGQAAIDPTINPAIDPAIDPAIQRSDAPRGVSTARAGPIGDDTVFIPGHRLKIIVGRQRRANHWVGGA